MIAVLALLSLFSSVDFPAPRKVDSSKVRQILSSMATDSSMPRSRDWTLVGPVGDSAILAVDGSEWGRIPWTSMVASVGAPEVSGTSGWEQFAPTPARLLEWGMPTAEGKLAVEMGNGKGELSTSLLDWAVSGEYRHQANRWTTLMGGISYNQVLFAPRLRPITGDSLRPAGMGLQVGACAPFVCFELQRHVSPVLDESWLQPGLDSLIDFHQAGVFWNAGADSGFDPTWEQRLVLHLGVLEYRARWCSDLWRGPFQRLGVWNIPVGVLRFGTGLEWTRSRAAVRAEFAFAPVAWTLRAPGSDGVRLYLDPFSASLGFRAMKEFQLTIRTSIRFPDPFASTPSNR